MTNIDVPLSLKTKNPEKNDLQRMAITEVFVIKAGCGCSMAVDGLIVAVVVVVVVVLVFEVVVLEVVMVLVMLVVVGFGGNGGVVVVMMEVVCSR